MSARRQALTAPLRRVAARTSVILCHHGAGRTTAAQDPSFLRVRTDIFRAEVEMLLESGFELVTVADLASRINHQGPPRGLAALSFDDGMDDNFEVVLPILEELGVPATVYVTTGLIGKPNPWLASSLGSRMMTADELRALAAAGFELGAHTVTHPDMSQLDYEACLDEMVASRDELVRITGEPVRTFAYPFGLYGSAAVDAAKAAGFEAAVTCHHLGDWTPFELKRPMITGKDGLASIVLKLTGAYYPLFYSAPGRALRATTRDVRGRVRAGRDRAAGPR